MTMSPTLALPLLFALVAPVAYAAPGSPPVVTPEAEIEASRVLSMPTADPAARFNQVLAAQGMSQPGLFALATRLPGLVEQLLLPPYTLALAYVVAIPAPDLHRVRRGETVIRTLRDLKASSGEYEAAEALAEALKLNVKRLEAIRLGPFEGRIIRVEVTASGKVHTVEMAWPSTPERDEASRDALGKYFGARPSARAIGAGAPLPLEDGSFEQPEALTTHWTIEKGPDLGGGTPAAAVSVDPDVSVDGSASLRFYATQKTRQFLQVSQRISVAPTMSLVARAMLATDNIRPEYQQKRTDLYLELQFEDVARNAVGAPVRAVGAGETHTWQSLEAAGIAPDNAAFVRVTLLSALSGTAWFDGLTLQIAD